jgi:hypothetical protein
MLQDRAIRSVAIPIGLPNMFLIAALPLTLPEAPLLHLVDVSIAI